MSVLHIARIVTQLYRKERGGQLYDHKKIATIVNIGRFEGDIALSETKFKILISYVDRG